MHGRKNIRFGAFPSNSSSEKLIISSGAAFNQLQPLCAWGRRAMLPLPPAALASCRRGGHLLLSLERELDAGRANQTGSVWPQQLCKHHWGGSILPAQPGAVLGCDRAASVLRVAQTPTRESRGTHGAGIRTTASETVTRDPPPHPALGTARSHRQRAHACAGVCGTPGRRMLQHLFAGGDTGASVPAELPLAPVSLTNGVWFGGGALMKAVPAAGTGRGAPA